MKLVFIFLLLMTAHSFSSEIRINVHEQPKESGNQENKITLIVEVTNGGKQSIILGELNDDLIGCEIELWFLGKGIKLRNKTDAKWRREQAFIRSGSMKLMSGESKTFTFELKSLLPDDPDNDDFAKSLIEDVEFIRSGKGRVVLEYRYEGKGAEPMIANGSFIIKKKTE